MKSRTLELISAGIFVAAWLLAARSIPLLPPQVPTHFGWDGAADRTGPATSLWALPALVTVMYGLLSAAGFMPRRWMNYPVKITDRNRTAVYALGREMLPAIKAGTLLTLLGVEWSAIDAAGRGSLGPFFTAAVFAPVALIVGVAIYYTLKMRAA